MDLFPKPPKNHAGTCTCISNWIIQPNVIYTCTIVFVIRQIFSFQNNPKNLDPPYKMDLDLWNCLGRVKLVL